MDRAVTTATPEKGGNDGMTIKSLHLKHESCTTARPKAIKEANDNGTSTTFHHNSATKSLFFKKTPASTSTSSSYSHNLILINIIIKN